MMNWKILALVVVLSGTLSGCLFRKKPVTPPPPPPPLPAPIQPAPPDPMPPPRVEPPAPGLPEELPPGTPEEELPPAPKPEPQRRRRNVRPAPAAPVNAPKSAPAEEPAAPALQLGEVMTPEQRAELRRAFDEGSAQARQLLGKLEGRALTAEQADSAARVKSFLSQAESLLEADPRSAAELARRAALLARDLAGGIR